MIVKASEPKSMTAHPARGNENEQGSKPSSSVIVSSFRRVVLIDVLVEVGNLEEVLLSIHDESNLVSVDEISQGAGLDMEHLGCISKWDDGFDSHGLNQSNHLGCEFGESFGVSHFLNSSMTSMTVKMTVKMQVMMKNPLKM